MSSKTGTAVRKQPSIPDSGCGAQVQTNMEEGTGYPLGIAGACAQKTDTSRGIQSHCPTFCPHPVPFPLFSAPAVLQPYVSVSVWVRGTFHGSLLTVA